MTVDESAEVSAALELARIERFEKLVESGERLDDSEVVSALSDPSESLRAEALDYLASITSSEHLIDIVGKLAEIETAVQCVARLVFLSFVWQVEAIRSRINYRSKIDEAEYIAVWDDAGRVLMYNDVGAAVRLSVQAKYGDWELGTVATNLISTVIEMRPFTESRFNAVDLALRGLS